MADALGYACSWSTAFGFRDLWRACAVRRCGASGNPWALRGALHWRARGGMRLIEGVHDGKRNDDACSQPRVAGIKRTKMSHRGQLLGCLDRISSEATGGKYPHVSV